MQTGIEPNIAYPNDGRAFLSPWQFSLLGDRTAPPARNDNRRWLLELRCTGRAEAYLEALRFLLNREPLFSSSFYEDVDGWYRAIRKDVIASMVQVKDVGTTTDEDILSCAGRMAVAIEDTIDISKPLLARFVYLQGERLKKSYFLIVLNHLLFDWVSVNLLVKELERQVQVRSPQVGTPAGFDSWTEEIKAYSETTFLKDRRFWIEKPWHKVAAIPIGAGDPQKNGAWATKFTRNFPVSASVFIKTAAKHRVHPVDIVVAALGELTWSRTGSGCMSIAFMEHGRPPRHLKTIGVFNYWWPLILERPDLALPELIYKARQARIISVPKYGYMLGRYGNVSSNDRYSFGAISKPQIHLNYTGEFGGGANALQLRALPSSAHSDFSQLKDIVLYVYVASDRFFFRWDYSAVVYNDADIDELASQFGEILSTILQML